MTENVTMANGPTSESNIQPVNQEELQSKWTKPAEFEC